MRTIRFVPVLLALLAPVLAQKRLVLIDEDGAGPGGSDQMAMLALLQSPRAEVLGITIVTGDAWRDEEVQHTLRMLELTGHSGVAVVPGAAFPLVRSQEATRLAALSNKVDWLGAWGSGPANHASTPWEVRPLPEGSPHLKPLDEDAAHFLLRQVRAHPRQVTLYAAGPLTNIALAVAIDPHFAEMTQEIVIMGGSLTPQHEFNFWFDPEAAHIVLRAHWPRIIATTKDVTMKAMFTQPLLDTISRSPSPAARYVAAYSQNRTLMWDELAACAWLDANIITKDRLLYMDVDLTQGPRYGNTLVWGEKAKPATGLQLVHAQVDLDLAKFTKMFVELMSSTTP